MGIIRGNNNLIGIIVPQANGTLPENYLECNGASLLRTDYPDLFTAITSAWGAADSTHFNLPDIRGRFLRGWSHEATVDPDRDTRTACNTGGNTGNNVGSIQTDDYKSHRHTYTGISSTGHTQVGSTYSVLNPDGGAASNVLTNDATATESRPLNAYVMYIIKYK